ncbi:DUF3732 domain-containing protein [Patulibacter sp. NPDC049589]|uniref:DUF3732 domain-containing protein n=1 Tax=Patulibacter sp. NPDC049589 TaxID=3154731 RepID=UPI003431E228
MQIESIVLYHRDGERVHEVPFQMGAVNVITGVSDTGKSAVLEIIDYCLGSSTHGVYRGDELESIGWYGLRLMVDGTPVFVARERPPLGQASSDRATFIIGAGEIPPASAIKQTTNIGSVIQQLGSLLGMGENEQAPPEGSTRAAVTATLRHATSYTFQRQRLVADPKYLFDGQEDNFKELHIRDTLPYFLGAVDQDALAQRRQLRTRRAELKAAEARLADVDNETQATAQRALALLADAREHQLVERISEVPPEHLRRALAEAVEHVPATAPALTGDAERIAALQDRKADGATELGELRAHRRAYVNRQRLARDLASESSEHRARLASLGLFPGNTGTGNGAECPLCGGTDHAHDPGPAQLRAELERASEQAAASVAVEPELQADIDALDVNIANLQGALDQTDREIQELVQRSAVARRTRGRLEQQAYVRGRITGFLEEHPPLNEGQRALLVTEAETARGRVEALEEALSADTTRTRTENALAYIGSDMTEMAKALRLSYAVDGVRLDPVSLTVVGRTPAGPVWLNRDIGSGKNWVGYHVVTLLALHKYFSNHRRPVPRLLILDQPTQAFFPKTKQDAPDRSLSDMKDEDQVQVGRIFDLIKRTVDELQGRLQVIIMDHAQLDTDWFAKAVGPHNWRGPGRGLVPTDWY